MTDGEYSFFRGWLKERSAIHLDAGKEYLVEARLAPVVRHLGLASVGDVIAKLRGGADAALQTRVVESLVTTETSFFRDHNPFEALRKHVLPELIAARQAERRLSVWCAAASTGQEPYSLAILLREHFPALATWRVTVLATDLSREVLAKARAGVYNQFEVNRGMPAALLLKHFTQQGGDWRVNDAVRAVVEFREMNLAGPWPIAGRFDLVLLRNVMIYFEVEMKRKILGRVAKVLAPGGYLLLGGAETTYNVDESYRRVEFHKTGFYQRG
ncbi:MAG: CheR family methyltransferase [Gemmataceae bacterium]